MWQLILKGRFTSLKQAYWMEKNKILDSSEGFNYINEINTLKSIISNNSNVNMQSLNKLSKR